MRIEKKKYFYLCFDRQFYRCKRACFSMIKEEHFIDV